MTGLVESVLGDAQHRGFLGPGAIADFVLHAQGYLDGLREVAGADCELDVAPGFDLGPGGGIPGLVLAAALPRSTWHLIERARARADWLTRAVARLGMADRVVVHHGAAETIGRGALRGVGALVVARRFAAPAVAAECAAPLLRVGGWAIFSDLEVTARWDESKLHLLGLAVVRTWKGEAGTYVLLQQQSECPERFPRSPGVPARRPLF